MQQPRAEQLFQLSDLRPTSRPHRRQLRTRVPPPTCSAAFFPGSAASHARTGATSRRDRGARARRAAGRRSHHSESAEQQPGPFSGKSERCFSDHTAFVAVRGVLRSDPWIAGSTRHTVNTGAGPSSRTGLHRITPCGEHLYEHSRAANFTGCPTCALFCPIDHEKRRSDSWTLPQTASHRDAESRLLM